MVSTTFPRPLVLEDLADGTEKHWKLVEPFVCRDKAISVVVPPHFLTDLASIPRFAWPVLDPTNDVAKAAVPHDWFYVTGGFVGPGLPLITRAQADSILYRGLRANGVGYARAQIIWGAVRVGGASSWASNVDARVLLSTRIRVDALGGF